MKRIFSFLTIVVLACCCTQKPTPDNSATDWLGESVVYEMNVRQLTPEGNFDAATQRLEGIKELGVDIVWVMPLYPIG